MADGTTARDRLGRVLHILPAASADGGAPLDALAGALEVDVPTLMQDITEVIARAYYHPAGSGDEIQIELGPERVQVWTKGSFRRPAKLSPKEAFCLALGLRGHGREAPALLERVERHLVSGGEDEDRPDEALDGGFEVPDAAPDPDGVRELLAEAARHRLRCRVAYLKPDEPAPEARVIHPYAVAHAEGRWYVIGWCEASAGARAFRLDRVLEAVCTGGTFEPREDVEVGAFLDGGRVWDGAGGEEAVVRYSPAIARWIAEWAPGAEPQGDGSLVVRHRVADPGWLVRHVVRYGGEAEVVGPEELRDHVRREMEKVAGSGLFDDAPLR